ncbi:Na(+)/H(+) antiporter NhaA OS=Tsukamurella paurometabola (strain ATCC 8368 / DSM / CCUG 35730/ CIP 100753 / JCM 10117 / KCTC 9821 / NBRC 16120 / NCIMB 702349 / NCTC 13040) OX=521096 GN=nhaA PE=3 SV=1 [Tsukamurella paurometabola]|uniref:Na(+)/H(+) antiporter NhaA n=1 Tax=Tsukamurella paurometabola (strain ATCC 8368 / DSM 20162 / CCUG 35730 / CIP 100753 / JCM 10117 / KCTC 9821 / NBRC 16120 / NCIMB 702349 / NCTC 13040) TaxID=521096 RepID=D5URX1_TSUPD|nr:Na+/H+ antiporter NhaA [Tsukamurella paurometabola]ADG79176.1 Na+/H+ antiporter NhaA [Tsukamurella paurometabola DSM 20162]SUP34405.1 Sodium/proton antiporter nhaA [Tsukamurella paurometabola]
MPRSNAPLRGLVLFRRGSPTETSRVSTLLRKEAVGGLLLVVAAVAALVAANTGLAPTYESLRGTVVGYAPFKLDLTLGQWASDGLLAIFFFLVGLELKRELTSGELRSPRTAIVPVVAAIGGAAVPALIYLALNAGGPGGAGWAIPTATDIAFAVAVLAVVGSHLPAALRLFLLTLAVVDDLLAIVIIAIAYTEKVGWIPLVWSAIPLALFAFLTHRYAGFFSRHHGAAWLILLPIGFTFWTLVHASGIHATIAGVLLGFAVPVLRGGPDTGLAEEFEHRFRPLSAGFAVPVFAFLAAGVSLSGVGAEAVTDPIFLGIVAGLVVGKPVGILCATWLVTKLTRSSLDPAVRWIDLLAVSLLAGIGFTVSLLIAELSFTESAEQLAVAKLAILLASTAAALAAGAILAARNRGYRRLADADADTVTALHTSSGERTAQLIVTAFVPTPARWLRRLVRREAWVEVEGEAVRVPADGSIRIAVRPGEHQIVAATHRSALPAARGGMPGRAIVDSFEVGTERPAMLIVRLTALGRSVESILRCR